MSYPIHIDPEVERIIGPQAAAIARRPSQPSYKCAGCDNQGRFTDPSSVVVLTVPGRATVIRYAHRACMPSSVGPGRPRSRQDPEADMTACAALLPGGSGTRAVLIIEPVARAVAITGVNDRVELMLPALERLGLTVLSSLTASAPAAAGWQLKFPAAGRALVLAPGGVVFYDGSVDEPAGWRDRVTGGGRAELLSGIIGLAVAALQGPGAQLQALHGAARSGMLAGGTITVAVGRIPGIAQTPPSA